MPRLLLVDDDENILTSVKIALEAEDFKVSVCSESIKAVAMIKQNPPDAIILDIKMPQLNGMELLQKIRGDASISQTPVIFLTSKDDEVDELMGLRMGADDYIKKPFSQKLLIERIKVLLRRQSVRKAPGADNSSLIVRGDLTIDKARHLCTWKGKHIELTVTEYLLLESIAQIPGHVKTRDQLMDAAYGESIYVDDRTIDSHVKRLRKKFKETDPDFSHIETLYGVGYKFKE
ncbi:MAG: response regulator transcription factor [Alphaproteobacteria bacterium]|nr:response regulator transcription factor [Alphaproteobacteria bacterium]MCL2504957.1 response regulator transcription factor [Alphaproteobacteria bacterium]